MNLFYQIRIRSVAAIPLSPFKLTTTVLLCAINCYKAGIQVVVNLLWSKLSIFNFSIFFNDSNSLDAPSSSISQLFNKISLTNLHFF